MKALKRIASTLLLFTLVFGGFSVISSQPAHAKTTVVTGTVTTIIVNGDIVSQRTSYSDGWTSEPRTGSFLHVSKEHVGTSYTYKGERDGYPNDTTIAVATYKYTLTERY